MFKSFMFMQWKVSRWPLAILVPLCAGLPILIMRFASKVAEGPYARPAVDMLHGVEIWLPIFPALAMITGITFALAAWFWDHNTNHVYALSLPIERWRYSLYKMGAGALQMCIAVIALLLGCIIATSGVHLPDGVHAYPFSFTFRFLLGALTLYALFFALAAGTIRTTFRLIIAFIVIFVFGSVFVSYLNSTFGYDIPTPMGILADAMYHWPGPFSVFGGSWMFIDV